MKKLILSIACSLCLLSLSSHAQVTVTYIFFASGTSPEPAGSALDELSSGTVLQSGLTLSAEAFLGASSTGARFNLTGSRFGITVDNPPDTGAVDITDGFDNAMAIANADATLVESMVFSFDKPGTFQAIDLRTIEGAGEEEALLIFGTSGAVWHLNQDTSLSSVTDNFNIGQTFLAGETIKLTLASGIVAEDFGLDSLTVEVIPEPSTYALIFGAMALGVVAWKKRRK